MYVCVCTCVFKSSVAHGRYEVQAHRPERHPFELCGPTPASQRWLGAMRSLPWTAMTITVRGCCPYPLCIQRENDILLCIYIDYEDFTKNMLKPWQHSQLAPTFWHSAALRCDVLASIRSHSKADRKMRLLGWEGGPPKLQQRC